MFAVYSQTNTNTQAKQINEEEQKKRERGSKKEDEEETCALQFSPCALSCFAALLPNFHLVVPFGVVRTHLSITITFTLKLFVFHYATVLT
jgi:hypothetical protein